ncbi:MAG: hypothetical protein CVU39_16320 [Chloroflexi bacterium HGW-Chloroflexi-10]|nr:MAG: hypothetical protein CVU39_16320 [Chloroflexi bacterium HGW-Chloroflexi-10]
MFSYLEQRICVPFHDSRIDHTSSEDLIRINELLQNREYSLDSLSFPNWFPAAVHWAYKQREPVVWMYLETADQDSGRFWMLLIQALRQHFPNVGVAVLNSLMDHHSMPMQSALVVLANEIGEKNWSLIMDNVQHTSTQPWWNQFVEWIVGLPCLRASLFVNHQNNILNEESQPAPVESCIFSAQTHQLQFELNAFLAVNSVWWLEWLEHRFCIQIDKVNQDWFKNGSLIAGDDLLLIPRESLLANLKTSTQEVDYLAVAEMLNQQCDWLAEEGEWLESIRLHLLLKNFEKAGDLFEQFGEGWLKQGLPLLELLFWLRELPSVLLSARPILGWLAAYCCHLLGLTTLQTYYKNAAENQLIALSHFCRNDTQWRTLTINEQGWSVQTVLDRLNILP